jgi:hypothetical protein
MRQPQPRARRVRLPFLALGLLGVLGAAAAPPAPPAINTVTAGDLAQFCVGSDHVSQNVCRIYILGVTQGVVLGLGSAGGAPAHLCVPAALSAETLEETVKARIEAELQAHPAAASQDGARFIVAMLGKAYKCTPGTAP